MVTKLLDNRKGSCYTDLIDDSADGQGHAGAAGGADPFDDDDDDDFPDIGDLIAQNAPAAV